MTEQMDPTRAARLLERWFSFYGMDDREAWPREDYPQIKRAYEAMQLAVEVLRGNTSKEKTGIQKAIAQLEEWPTIHSMEDPDDWEPVDFPFVRNVLEAMRFAAAFLKEQQAGNTP
ncbi:MAG: hypothetical protein KJ650_07365 [Firmicutes bacterium]|jgi:hypothetical protein|nr:hypothetical protein [Bacillota bacterium]MBU4533427.1 hypothetical protein [Bacillota bacterium]MBV1727848.1 hypothetical protein [Desulforudis sp.]MBV1735279.1 hypothetical protein [Desulforudis sp.]